jgi:hypothetical protein
MLTRWILQAVVIFQLLDMLGRGIWAVQCGPAGWIWGLGLWVQESNGQGGSPERMNVRGRIHWGVNEFEKASSLSKFVTSAKSPQ